jgi:hypothetical protein
MHNKGSKNLIITPRTQKIIRFFSNLDGTAMEEKNRPGSLVRKYCSCFTSEKNVPKRNDPAAF